MRIGIEAAQQGKIPPMRNLRVEQPCRDGSTVWTEVNSRLIVNTDNGSMQFIGLTRDITKAIAYEQELHRLVVTDRLTGLYNRHKLDQVLESNQKLFERYQTQFGVLLLDIDHFKNINDTHGHQVGDTTLRTLAELLTNSSRDTDVIGRWGGEEFLIVVSYADKESLLIFAENLRNQVELYLFDVIEHITISVGVSVFQEGCGTNDVISKADQALYYAKENGRNQVHFSD
jgi:diguanylate cyclase (GGDEF)-like protein